MKIGKKARVYSIIAGVCFLLVVLYGIIRNYRYIFTSFGLFNVIIPHIILLIFIIILFIGKKDAVHVLIIGDNLLYRLILGFYSYGSLFDLLIWISLFIIILSAISKNKKRINRYIWFIPALLHTISTISVLSNHNLQFGFQYDWTNSFILYILIPIIGMLAFIFAGLYYKTEDVNPENSFIGTTISGADNLKMYKELLDSGAITQFEFEAKKQEILRTD